MTDGPISPAMSSILQAVVIIALATLLLPTSEQFIGRSRGYYRVQRTEELCDHTERESMPSATLRDDGSVWDPKTSTSYPKGTYWRAMEKNSSAIYGCPCMKGRPCLRKCCEIDMVMNSKMKCVKRNSESNDGGAWFRSVISELISEANATVTDYGLLTGKHCKSEREPFKVSKPRIKASDFSLCTTKYSGEVCFNYTNFCVDYNEKDNRSEPILCTKHAQRYKKDLYISRIASLVAQTLSSTALVIIIIVYFLVPELRTTYGKCHMCHSFALLLYYVLENILVSWPQIRLVKGACAYLDPVEMFFYLAPISWLNMVSLDILFAFVSLRPVHHVGGHGDLKKLILYSTYAWGLPAIYVITTFSIHFTAVKKLSIVDICRLGLSRKWWSRRYAMYALFTVNGIIFAMTAYKIYSLKRTTSKSMGHDSGRHIKNTDSSAERAKIYLKLSLLMGLHWIPPIPIQEILLSIVKYNVKSEVRVLWRATTIALQLQGVFTLIVFMRNKKLSRSVWKKLNKSKLWTNFTGKIIEMSSSSKQTTPNIELRDANAPPASALASSQGDTVSILVNDDLGTKPSDIEQTPSPTVPEEEISNISEAAESQGNENMVGFSNAGFIIETSDPAANSSEPVDSSPKENGYVANAVGIIGYRLSFFIGYPRS